MKWVEKIKKNTIILLIFTIIILYIVLKNDAESIIEAFKKIDIKYIILAVICYAFSIILKGYSNYLITNNKKKISAFEAIKHNLIAQFFNGVTPFSSGGQPMEIYMITEHDIPLTRATNQTVQSFIFYQLALVICGFLAVLYNAIFGVFPKVTILKNLVIIGFLINIAIVVVLLLISHSKKITNRMSRLVIKIGHKLHLKIDEEHIKNAFNDYYKGFCELKKRKSLFVKGLTLNILSLWCLYLVPLFILYSMGHFNDLNAITTITASAYVYIIGAFVPIPGASGGIEYGFTQFFGYYVGSDILSAVLLLWRFITYYLGVILGALTFSLEKKEKK